MTRRSECEGCLCLNFFLGADGIAQIDCGWRGDRECWEKLVVMREPAPSSGGSVSVSSSCAPVWRSRFGWSCEMIAHWHHAEPIAECAVHREVNSLELMSSCVFRQLFPSLAVGELLNRKSCQVTCFIFATFCPVVDCAADVSHAMAWHGVPKVCLIYHDFWCDNMFYHSSLSRRILLFYQIMLSHVM